jgi:sucrose-phosphate synthase
LSSSAGHYADAGEVAVLMSSSLDVHMVMTGHSLGRNKLEHLLASGAMTRSEIEEAYAISRRIEAEERCLDNAVMVFTSTRQEVDEQWGLYDGYSPQLSRVLRFHRSMGRHMPNMKVIPPGLDFSNLKVSMPEDPTLKEFEQARALQDMLERPQPLSPLAMGAGPGGVPSGASSPRPGPALRAEASEGAPASPAAGGGAADPATPSIPSAGAVSSGHQSPRGGGSSGGGGEVASRPPLKDLVLDPVAGPPIWREITRFLRNPGKPAVLAMSRPDPKKNLTTLVRWRELAAASCCCFLLLQFAPSISLCRTGRASHAAEFRHRRCSTGRAAIMPLPSCPPHCSGGRVWSARHAARAGQPGVGHGQPRQH